MASPCSQGVVAGLKRSFQNTVEEGRLRTGDLFVNELPDGPHPRRIGPVGRHNEVGGAAQKHPRGSTGTSALCREAMKAGITQRPCPAAEASIWACRLEL